MLHILRRILAKKICNFDTLCKATGISQNLPQQIPHHKTQPATAKSGNHPPSKRLSYHWWPCFFVQISVLCWWARRWVVLLVLCDEPLQGCLILNWSLVGSPIQRHQCGYLPWCEKAIPLCGFGDFGWRGFGADILGQGKKGFQKSPQHASSRNTICAVFRGNRAQIHAE